MERLAIIVPCLNEEKNIEPTSIVLLNYLHKLINSLEISSDSYILFIDDGSEDNTWLKIKEIKSKNEKNIKAFKLYKNYGHQNALLFGMFNSDFDICITLDADLQDDHKKIPFMISKYKKGYNIVCGIKKINFKKHKLKNFFSCVYYFFLNLINKKIIISHADFRLMSKKAVMKLKDKFNNTDLFIRGAVPLLDYPIYKFKYKISSRKYGVTRYTPAKILNLARYGIVLFKKEIGKILGFFIILDIFINNKIYKKISFLFKLGYIWLLIEYGIEFITKDKNDEKIICEKII